MDDLYISTITAILQLSHPIDLKKVYTQTPINEYIPFIEYGESNEVRGFSKKMLKKKRKEKKKRIFYNQATIHVSHAGKLMNVKLFNNGKFQMTGLKKETHPLEISERLIHYFQSLDIVDPEMKVVNHRIVLINSNFELGFEINRDILHKEIVQQGIYSSFEPCIYPGVNIKYYINTNNSNGVCCCNSICNGKGRANGDGDCKKVTIAVFKSGNIIITGGQNKKQLYTAYQFINKFINERKEQIMLQ